MDTELRSGRLIGYIFAIPGSIIAVTCLCESSQHGGFLLLSLIFGFGAFVGVNLILHPRILVRANHGFLELYPGTLFSNRKQIEIPLVEIEGFRVRTIQDGDGTCWLLSLFLRNPLTLSQQAQRWIETSVPKNLRDQAGETTILWTLTWPAGGVRGAQEKMEKLTRVTCQPASHSSRRRTNADRPPPDLEP